MHGSYCESTRYSCQIIIKLEFSQQIFEKYSSTKFHKNSSSRSKDVPCGWKEGRTDMSKLTVAFRNFPNALQRLYVTYISKIVLS